MVNVETLTSKAEDSNHIIKRFDVLVDASVRNKQETHLAAKQVGNICGMITLFYL